MYNIKINIAADNAVGDPLYMEDWGLKIEFEGLTLPTAYEVHFSNNPASPAKMAIGDSSGVVVPYEYTAKSGTLYGWLVFTNPSSGYTKRSFTVAITRRSPLDPPQVLPEQVTVIDTAIAALNAAIVATSANVAEAAASAENAAESATAAANSAAEAAASVEQAAEKVDEAQEAATAAATSATAASSSAATSQAAATRADFAMNAARTSAESADESAGLAQTAVEESADNAQAAAESAEQAAASKAQAATDAARAQTYATRARASANTASDKATSASNSAGAALNHANNAANSATAAGQAQTAAEAAAGTATEKAAEAGQSATDAAESAAEAQAAATEAGQIVDDATAFALGAYATSSAYGAVATVDDGAADVPVKALTAYIVPVQEGTGDPSPDNVRAIHGFTGMEIARTGANIWDEEWEQGTFETTTGNALAKPGQIRSKKIIPVVPNTEYYVTTPLSGTDGLWIIFYDANLRVIPYAQETPTNYSGRSGNSYRYNNQSFTTSPSARYCKFYAVVGYGETYNHDISINHPASDTQYHPYTDTTYPVTWQDEAGTVYGGYFDAVTGVLTVTCAAVDMGTLTWTYNTNDTVDAGGCFSAPISGSVPYNRSYIAEIYKTITDAYGLSNVVNVHGSSVDNAMFSTGNANSTTHYAIDSRFTDAAAFKAAVTGQTLVYELANPITYQLTPQEIKTLKGVNNIFADTGDTDVIVRADPDLHLAKLIAQAVAVALENA